MKNLISIIILLMIFSSCNDTSEDIGCNDAYVYKIEFIISSCALRNGNPIAYGELIEWTATNYKCNGESYSIDGKVKVAETGCGVANEPVKFKLYNNNDYVIITARHITDSSIMQESQRYSYADFTEAEKAEEHKIISQHFTFNDF